MKTLQRLVRRAERFGVSCRDQWWRVYVADASRKTFGHALGRTWNCVHPDQADSHPSSHPSAQRRPPIIVVVAVLSLTSVVGYRFYNEPRLDVGTVAPQTIRAPLTATVEDLKTTEERRREARTGAVSVLMLDSTANQQIQRNLAQALEQGSELRQKAGEIPFMPVTMLSMPTQLYLRQAEEWEWRAILEAVDTTASADVSFSGLAVPETHDLMKVGTLPLNSSQQQAIAELQSYRQITSSADFAALVETILQARSNYPLAIAALNSLESSPTKTLYDADLFSLSDEEWQQTQEGIKKVVQRMMVQGIHPGLPNQLLQNAVQVQIQGAVPIAAEAIAINLLPKVLQPNLMRDPEQTKLRAEQAAQEVKPVMVTIQRGEVIVEEGKPITQADFVLLDHFRLSRREINWPGLIGFGVLVSGAIAIVWWVERRFHPGLRRQDHVLILLLTLSAPVLAIFGVAATSLPAIGLLIGSFYGSALGVTVVGLLTILLPIGMEITGNYWLASATGGLLGTLIAGRLRSREELALLGGAVGLTQGVAYLILTLILNAASGPVWYLVLSGAMLHGLVGLAWSIVALGLSPYLEHIR